MKKKMFLMACLAVWGVLVAKAQLSIATLHHEGSVTIYSGSEIQTAIDNAVAGDTIYLSEGVFDGFTVAKDISIIGSGITTTISRKVTIGESKSLLLSNMFFLSETTTPSSGSPSISDLRIVQCVFAGDLKLRKGSTIEIIQSVIKGELCSDYSTLNITVSNSKINTISGNGEPKKMFINCNIKNTTASTKDHYQNCIIISVETVTLRNCLWKQFSGSPNFVDCYQSSDFTLDDDLNCSLTDAELAEKGYLGTDGKVVGINGGELPFTLESPILQVTEHQLDVDNVNKQLKVTLKLGNK